ncbi:MAG: GNAT family N-acetyltransferase [Bacilli bacterium]|nr:GNAT family N-acetyltransferase [Bacilli bacterium]
MVIIQEVKTNKQIKQFVNFPLELYKDTPYFVPPLYNDEIKVLKRKSPYETVCESIFFLAYIDNKVVGRIQGIIQKQYNEIKNERRIRFSRFDAIDNQEVANKLFEAVENWAKSKNMDTVCGPLGFSDFEREGLLIEGFDQDSTFEEQYNFDYYQRLIENCGYQKEVDWVESRIFPPENAKEQIEKLKRLTDLTLKRAKVHLADTSISDRKYINLYKDAFFDVIEEGYKEIYGVVPFTPQQRKLIIDSYRPVIKSKYLFVLLDESDKAVGIGLVFPSFSDALRYSKGKLYPKTLFKFLKAINHPTVVDLGLVAVLPEYRNSGITSAFMLKMMEFLADGKIKYFETNLNLEDNLAVRTQWNRFNSIENKKRRSFIKKL